MQYNNAPIEKTYDVKLTEKEVLFIAAASHFYEYGGMTGQGNSGSSLKKAIVDQLFDGDFDKVNRYICNHKLEFNFRDNNDSCRNVY